MVMDHSIVNNESDWLSDRTFSVPLQMAYVNVFWETIGQEV